MADVYKSAGIIIQAKKLLITRTKGRDSFYSPGGKIEAGETPAKALIRELKEELDVDIHESDLEAFGTFHAEVIEQPDKSIKMVVFTVKNYTGDLKPSGEIEEIKWVSTADFPDTPLGSIFVHKVMPRLRAQGLID